MAASYERRGPVIPLGEVKLQVVRATLSGVTVGDMTQDDHGFSNIIAVIPSNQTTADDAGIAYANKDNTGTAAIGTVGLSDFTSGDVVDVLIIGN